MANVPAVAPLPVTEQSRLRDRIQMLETERDRLRTELSSAGGEIGVRLRRAETLCLTWRARVAEFRTAANDPHLAAAVSGYYRAIANRIEAMANELSKAGEFA